MADIINLQNQWTHLYRDYLPELAKARDPSQKKWPVYLDHCFARILLDNAVGKGTPWTDVITQPAVKNMDAEQFHDAIALAEKVATGDVDLVELNNRSLEMRGKKKRKVDEGEDEVFRQEPPAKKKKKSTEVISSYFLPSPSTPDRRSVPGTENRGELKSPDASISMTSSKNADMVVQLKRISDSSITAFRKQALGLLCQIPRGRYSTYQALSDHISKTSHKTCARAVGNAMRNNPFAPEVPCHRVLANDGSLGGFKGHWGEGGKFANKKHELLFEEGVRFDSKGKVKGPVFREFR